MSLTRARPGLLAARSAMHDIQRRRAPDKRPFPDRSFHLVDPNHASPFPYIPNYKESQTVILALEFFYPATLLRRFKRSTILPLKFLAFKSDPLVITKVFAVHSRKPRKTALAIRPARCLFIGEHPRTGDIRMRLHLSPALPPTYPAGLASRPITDPKGAPGRVQLQHSRLLSAWRRQGHAVRASSQCRPSPRDLRAPRGLCRRSHRRGARLQHARNSAPDSMSI